MSDYDFDGEYGVPDGEGKSIEEAVARKRTQTRGLSPQERHDRLQEAWLALCQIDAHLTQDGFEIDLGEKRLEASQAVGDVIEHYQRYNCVSTEVDGDE